MTTKLATIRFADRADVKAILEIETGVHRALGRPGRAMTEPDVVEFVGRDRTRIDVMETDDGAVVGYLLFVGGDAEEAAEIKRLTVAPGERRVGRGLLLLERAVKWARKSRAETLVAHVYEQDLDGQLFFKDLGFESRVTRDKYGRGEDAVTFTAAVASLGERD